MAKNAHAKLDALAAQLERKLGDNLATFALYGPAVRHDTRERDRELTTLLILNDASPVALRPVEDEIAGWVKKGNPPPLIFAEQGWRGATDVFPIEIEDMRDAHELLHGDDPFGGLSTDKCHLRHELDREIRGKLLQLRAE